MGQIEIKNTGKLPLTLNLPHALVPEHASMRVVGVRDVAVSGERELRAIKKPIGDALTLIGGESRRVAASARSAPDVERARRAGRISITDVPDAPTETMPSTTAPAGAESTHTQKRKG